MEWYGRDLGVGDADSVLDAFRSNADMNRQGHVVSLETAQLYVSRLMGQDHRTRVAAEHGTDQLLALVSAQLDHANASAWVFYWAHARAWGAGITSDLVRNFCNDLLRDGLYRLELGYRVDNRASGRVAERAGFIIEGREREKFLIDGKRIDVMTCGRLRTDPWPADDTSRL